MSIIRNILDFLELRPVFTLRAVQVLWWLHIAQTLYRTHWGWTELITPSGRAPTYYNWLDFVFTPLRVLVALATARQSLDKVSTEMSKVQAQDSDAPRRRAGR